MTNKTSGGMPDEPQNIPGSFASSEDLALALGATPIEAKAHHARLERLAGATLKEVAGVSLPDEPNKYADMTDWIEHSRTLRTFALQAVEERDDLVERLNHAVTELMRAATSEDFDSEDCFNCVEAIQNSLKKMGKTSDHHIIQKWYDDLCEWCGVSNGDEINIMPIVQQKLQSATDAEAKLAGARREALEEAAKVCEGNDGEGPDTWGWHQKDYARAIRALLQKGVKDEG